MGIPVPPQPSTHFGTPMTWAEWVARSGISVVFALALLWWVLDAQTKALSDIARVQAETQKSLERLASKVETCVPSAQPYPIR